MSDQAKIETLEKYSRDQERFNGRLSESFNNITNILTDIQSKIKDVSDTAKRVEIQAEKTNGRVNNHDKEIAKLFEKLEKGATSKQIEELHKELILYKSSQSMVDEAQSKDIKSLREERIAFNSKVKMGMGFATFVSVCIGLFFQFVSIVILIIAYFVLNS